MAIPVNTALDVLKRFTAECTAAGEPPVAAVITCAAGETIAALRMDGVAPRIMGFAQRKAYAAAWRESTTLAFKTFLVQEGLTLADFGNPRLTSMPGGAPVRLNGQTIGGVGISGRLPAEDHRLAEALAARLLEALGSR